MAGRSTQDAQLLKAFRHALANAVAQAEMQVGSPMLDGEYRHFGARFTLPDQSEVDVALMVTIRPGRRNARGELLLTGPRR
jgi:hypothetical protein